MSEATVIALGFFDGVHLGHGALLRKTAERARELGVTPAAFTFDRSPKEFVTGVPVPLLTSAAERAEIIREYYGIGTVFVEPFDRAMMTMPWEDFITELLVKKYRAVHLVAGHDFRFGYKNQGDPEKLREKCRALGLGFLTGLTLGGVHLQDRLHQIVHIFHPMHLISGIGIFPGFVPYYSTFTKYGKCLLCTFIGTDSGMCFLFITLCGLLSAPHQTPYAPADLRPPAATGMRRGSSAWWSAPRWPQSWRCGCP